MPSANTKRLNQAKIDDTYEVSSAALLNIDLDVGFEDGEEFPLFYGMGVGRPREIEKNLYAFQVCARAGNHKKGTKEASTSVEAFYGVIITTTLTGAEQLLGVAKHCARHVIWGRYCVWYSATTSQVPVSLPPLPLLPEKVEYDEELDEFQSGDDGSAEPPTAGPTKSGKRGKSAGRKLASVRSTKST